MLASNEGPSRRSMGISFEELNRLAEELQNITPEDTITFKERIREALNGLQYLKVTSCESRLYLERLKNLFIVFNQDLSRQSESSDPRLAVFRCKVSTLIHSGPGRFQKNTYCILNPLLYLECNCRCTLRKRGLEYGITFLVGFSKTSNDELDNFTRAY